MKKAYLAGPWFTEKANILENYAYTISELCKNNYEVFRPRAESCLEPAVTFNGNIAAIKSCDIFVALISEKDVGTAFEIGYANALGKKVYLVAFEEVDFNKKTNLMLAFASDKCITIDKLHKVFEDTLTNNDVIYINRDWEDIE